jgi:tyrosyl-tRNA synthetase
VYVNNLRVQDVNATVGSDDAVDGRFIVLRKGKKHYRLVRLL